MHPAPATSVACLAAFLASAAVGFAWPEQAGAQAGAGGAGVRIESVEPGSVAAQAGLAAGDVLVGWRLTNPVSSPTPDDPASGVIADGDAYEAMSRDVLPRRAVTLDVWRSGATVRVPVPIRGSRLGAAVAPAPATIARFDEAIGQRRWADAHAIADVVLADQGPAQDTLAHAAWRLRRAMARRQLGKTDDARADADLALAVRQRLAPGSWDEADALAELGRIAVAQRRLDEAMGLFQEALAIVNRSPAPSESVRLGFALADVEWRSGRLSDAEQRVNDLLTLAAAFDPDSADQARNYNLLGILCSQRGDLPAAEQAFRLSHAIHARRDPGGADEANALNNLGIAAMQRGRYGEAESYYRRSLAIKERLRLPPLEAMSTLGNLGLMSVERGDLESARGYLSRALAIVRQAAPGSLQEGGVLSNLARAERLAGRVPEAERLVGDSLAIRSRLAPNTVLHAFTLTEMGKVHEASGALDEAAAAHRQALAIREQLAPDGSNVADSLDALGRIAARQGRTDEARRLLDRAGALWQRVAPGSIYEGLNLLAQARLDVAAGQPSRARVRYADATRIYDETVGDVGGAFDTQADFRQRMADAYGEYAEVLLSLGETAEAFHVTERARARVFLAMLAERDVAMPDDAPAELRQTRRALASEYERLQSELAALSPTRDGAAIDERIGRMRDVRLKLASVNADASRVSPRPAAQAPPAPLNAEAARRVLPPGTLALSYLVGPRVSRGFVLSASGLDTFEIPIGREDLAERTARFERLVTSPDDDGRPLTALAADLYRLLIAPAEAALARHQRLLIVPDGALHRLPFAALVRESGRRLQYLVEWRPVYQVPSLTVYHQLMSLPSGRTAAAAQLLAVGDPLYRRGAAAAPALPPLPGTRREVDAVSRAYGRRASTLLGTDATESRVRQAIADADIIHLAVHGLVNSRFPLDSALALSTDPAQADTGLLQAWEIFEQVRLRARLVVLSACDTAGSRESGGEGLLGLVRAFQFAGAPSVVGTLWRVSDDRTPALMNHFHRHLRRGDLAVADALAGAQRAMLRSAATAHPYHWAGFVLNGRP
ncbi:MAG: CHAT domain-containing protein [Vicinamibacterales bacterium]